MPSFPRRPGASARAVGISVALSLLAVPAASAQDPAAPPAPAPAPAPQPTIAAGVKVGGIDLSGQTAAQATKTLSAALRGQRPSDDDVVVTIANRKHRISMADIKYRYDASDTAEAALKAPAGAQVPPVIAWTDSALQRRLKSLASMQRKPRNATIRIGIAKQRPRGSRRGWKVNRTALTKLVTGALQNPAADRARLTLKVTRTSPSVTISDLRRRYGTLITVDRNTFRLRLFKRLRWTKTYKIAVGAAGHTTPAGMYSVTSKQVNPAWHVPNSAWAGSLAGQVIPGGAPNNPLKARWLGLRDGIGIHGTAEAWSIGGRASHGCIRMHPHDVIDLYDRVPMGTPVKIR